MLLQNLASKEGRQVAGHNIQSWVKRSRHSGSIQEQRTRYYGTEKGPSSQLREEWAKEHVKGLSNKQKAKREARAIDKDFFMSVLGSSATKREAKSYLQRFTPSKDPSQTTKSPLATDQRAQDTRGCGVNLGGFYGPAAVEESPQFVQYPGKRTKVAVRPQLHVALVKLRATQTLDDETLNGIGRTLSQLERLGLISVVVVDSQDESQVLSADAHWRAHETKQANRVVAAIDASGESGARLVDNVIGVSEAPSQEGFGHGPIHITLRKLLMTPLRRGVIPVIPSVGYTDITQTAVPVAATDVVLALTRELAGLPSELLPDEDPNAERERLQALREEISLDRLIILDPLGGIPTSDLPNGYHVFLNMEQEFDAAKLDLLRALQPADGKSTPLRDKESHLSDIGASNPLSKFVEIEFGGPHPSIESLPQQQTSRRAKSGNTHHLQNLELVRRVLSILPPSSSALLTTPREAANSGKDVPFQAARVGTRRQRNPLIHNLLTDKPVFSSSLPMGRLGGQASINSPVSPTESITPTTFAKHGMSVTIFPDPKVAPWTPPVPGQPHLTLTDSKIDLPRLVHLIEDSFGRKLDVQEYLERVNDRIAGVIIAGEYEGGALLTWETPPGVKDDGSPESRARMVPYLDKFAVLKRSQGSGGVADLIFKAMVRDCFPHGVVWRSRKTNPVNKWYFERSRGTWKLPGTGWTMFWTTPELSMDKQLFLDYEGVCRGIEPSWADNKALLD
ncbi:mitochondrial amino-acid acetyltransferase [Stipitochalara longipes BDJ]|nr:mitochondrial amino-acid acetyltransferase [Stipitochalara longipes BDJ]